ncbi:MAG: thioredoxin family protein, partial [Lentisphaeria bacterium]
MKIIVLGTGSCSKCKVLAANVNEAVDKLQLSAEVTKDNDINKLVEFGVMSPPALIIDGVAVSSGHVLTVQEICRLLKPDGEL